MTDPGVHHADPGVHDGAIRVFTMHRSARSRWGGTRSLYFQLHDENIHAAEVCGFLREVLRHLRGHLIVLWDGGKIHKGPLVRALCAEFPRLHLERFPPYAPELNPDEGVWTLAKGRLANGRPDDRGVLWAQLFVTLLGIRYSPRLLRGCVTQSDLPPFLR